MFFLLNVHKSFGMAGYTAIDNWNQHQEGNILVYWRNWGTPYFKSWNFNWFLPLCRAYTLHPVHDSVWYLPWTLLGVSSLPSMRQFASLPFFFLSDVFTSLISSTFTALIVIGCNSMAVFPLSSQTFTFVCPVPSGHLTNGLYLQYLPKCTLPCVSVIRILLP